MKTPRFKINDKGFLVRVDISPPFVFPCKVVDGRLEFYERDPHKARARGNNFVYLSIEELGEILSLLSGKEPTRL